MLRDKCLLITFIKNPVKGEVKTRLAADMGEDNALKIYRDLLAQTRKIALAVNVDRQVYYSRYVPDHDDWPSQNFEKRLQEGDNLGERMQNAFTKAFMDGYQKVVLIGSDCISLTPGIIAQAFDELGDHETVVGPASDGGYYLLGMRNLLPQLFKNKSWSTEFLLEETLQTIEDMNVQAVLLKELSDIDTQNDYLAHKHLFGRTGMRSEE